VATRTDPQAPFALLDHWRRDGAQALTRDTADGGTATLEMPDGAEWRDDRHFALSGRRDGAVQVGGHNVFPERVRERLLEHAGIADAAVRMENSTGRLKAFIVPAGPGVFPGGAGGDASLDELDAWCGARMTDAERPRRFTTGVSLPRNAMGKLADW